MTNPVDRLQALKARESDLSCQLSGAQTRRQMTQSALNDSRNIASGYEHAKQPSEIEARDQAAAKADELLKQLRHDNQVLSTLEQEMTEVRTALRLLFEGEPGYQNALAVYQAAQRKVLAAADTAQASSQQQAAAVQALSQARQLRERATADQRAALDGAAMAKARTALDRAAHAVEDAETLLANLQRHSDRLQADHKNAQDALEEARRQLFQSKATRLATQLREQTINLALEAFAASQLAGSGWSFREYVADTLDPHREAVPAGVESHRKALLTAVDDLP